ncbi:hypothetical protein [Rhodanobacter sp. Soil772]|uniref:hypothetical protein n=1 Tax=Rhodanobacter sp. Soil772 TaxID=1736406 RepID=UPI000A8F45E5|nr:hypothetical protein [Rhodanobacter sp. Soil772]
MARVKQLRGEFVVVDGHGAALRAPRRPSNVRHSGESWNPAPWLFKGLESLDPSFRWDDEQKPSYSRFPEPKKAAPAVEPGAAKV